VPKFSVLLHVLCIGTFIEPYGRVSVGVSGLGEWVLPSCPNSSTGSVDGWAQDY